MLGAEKNNAASFASGPQHSNADKSQLASPAQVPVKFPVKRFTRKPYQHQPHFGNLADVGRL
jgi:hypothetical protein